MVDKIREDREQLFAEALANFLAGASWWDVPIEAAMAEVSERTESDPWEPKIRAWIAENDSTLTPITTTGIITDALDMPIAQAHSGTQRRVVQILAKIGYIAKKTKHVRYYVRAE